MENNLILILGTKLNENELGCLKIPFLFIIYRNNFGSEDTINRFIWVILFAATFLNLRFYRCIRYDITRVTKVKLCNCHNTRSHQRALSMVPTSS